MGMKWVLVGVFCELVVASFLACAMIPDPSADGRTILIWVSDPNPARRGAIELLEAANPDIKVQLDVSITSMEKVIVQCKGGVGPDIFSPGFPR